MQETIFDSQIAKILDLNADNQLDYVTSKGFSIDYNESAKLILTCPMEAYTHCCFQVIRSPTPVQDNCAAHLDGIHTRLRMNAVNEALNPDLPFVELGNVWDSRGRGKTEYLFDYLEIKREGHYFLYAAKQRNPAVFDRDCSKSLCQEKPIVVELYRPTPSEC